MLEGAGNGELAPVEVPPPGACRPPKMPLLCGVLLVEGFWAGLAPVKLKAGAPDDPFGCDPNMPELLGSGALGAAPPPNWKLNDPDGVGVDDPAPNAGADALGAAPPAEKVKDPGADDPP
jgi:hypothetical protein